MAQSKAKNGNKQASNGETEHRRQEVQQAIKSACDQLRDDGVDPRDYVEQLAWLFFLKAFDEMESRREEEAAFDGSPYRRRLDGEYRWSGWSAMSNRPDQMLEFVDEKLWPHLRAFGETEDTRQFANDPIAERFRRIFWTVRNHSRRGASFAQVTQQVNRLHFGDETDVIVLSELYEGLLKDVAADSPGYAGEFYTQRHIIQAMINVVRPKIGDRIYDPCFGTAGFLAESAEYIRNMEGTLSGSHLDQLQQKTFYGIELKPLTYLLGTMNMLLHRIEEANIELGNTLELHSTNVPENDRYDVILSNPPYGGKMARELQNSRGANLPRVAMRALWSHRVPAPPIEEQERVVGQIQEVCERVREIQMLRRESLAEAAALESAVFSDSILELTQDSNVPVVTIGDIAQVNPRRDSRLRSLDEDLAVTFVPMAAVDEETGTIASPEVKPLGDVRKGFTPFLQGDVIFAKITPCMQNGKSAIAQSLVNGLGFGSTEFHVLRPGPVVLPQWLWYFVRQRSFREEARRHFRGSAGQQRVPAAFVEQHKIPLPSLEQQRRIVSRIQERLKRVNEICRLLRFTPTRKVGNQIDANTSAADPDALMQAVLRKAFAGEF